MSSASRVRVLAVDDDETILALVARYLGAKGLEVLTSNSPLDVSALVLRHRPDVVVLDISMPALDGEALAHVLRGTAGGRVPIVLHSALAPDRLGSVGARVGAKKIRCKGRRTRGAACRDRAATVR